MKYKYTYGPIQSWRLGRSLGVDPVYTGKGKICSFDCIYCQAGRTRILTNKRKIFVPTEKILLEIKSLPALKIDYITFSGAGEPTLAKNLGEIVKEIRKIRKEKIAILTNSSIIDRKDVQDDLALMDFVIAKLDAPSEELFKKINMPIRGIKFDRVIKGLKKFRSRYRRKLALQIMFVKENKGYAKEIADLARQLKPDEIELNTPLRPCESKPLSKAKMNKIKIFFKDTNYINVYDVKKKKVSPISKSATLRRRGKYDV